MIRVLHLIHDLGVGGAEKQLVELVARLPAHGVAPEVVTILDRGALRARVAALGVPLHTLGCASPADAPRALFRLAALLARIRPDALQTWLVYSDLLGRLLARPAGVPVLIGSSRNTDDWRTRAHILADRFTAPLCDAVVCNTLAGAARLAAVERLPPGKLRVIHNGVDPAACRAAAADPAAARAACGIAAAAPLVVAAGRLHPQKDFATLLSAFARLRGRVPEARLVVAGDGPERGELLAAAERLGIRDAVRLPGAVSPLAPLLASADAVALSSVYEGMPNVLLEAGALARPVVATEVGGVPELVRAGVDGLLVPARDPAALASALSAALLDRPRAAGFGASLAARVAERFPLERTAARHAALYRELLDAKRPARRPVPRHAPEARPLRVLLVVTRTDVGGAQKHVFDLAVGLAAAGVRATVAGGAGGDLLERLAARGIPTIPVAALDRDIAPRRDLAALLELSRIIRRVAPDLVHAHSSKAGLLARLAASALRVPAVYTAHGFAFHERMRPLPRRLYRLLERAGGALGAGLIAVSGRDLSTAEREGIGAGAPRRAIPNGIDPDDLARRLAPRDKVRAALGVAPDELLVGALGRHCDEKAYDTLVEAVALLDARGTAANARFAVFGDGVPHHRERAIRMAAERGLAGRIVFSPGVDPSRLPYAGFDLYALPSRKEGMPYTLLEACAAALCPVATDVGGVPEVLGDAGPRPVPPDDPAAFAAALEAALALPAAERRAIGATLAARVAEKFTRACMIGAIMEFYREVLRDRGRTER